LISNKKLSFLKVYTTIIGMALATDAVYFIFNNFMAVINGLLKGLITLVTQKFFDSVTESISNQSGMHWIIVMGLVLIGTIIVSQVINGLNNFMGRSFFAKVRGYMLKRIIQKSDRLDLISYEDPRILDEINKATMGANNSLGLLFTTTVIISYYIPYFVFMFAYLFSLDPILSVSLIFIFTPVALVQFVRSKMFTKLEEKVAPLRRQYVYYKTCMGNKDTRVLGAFQYFLNLYKKSVELFSCEKWKVEKKIGTIELLMRIVTILGYLVILLLFANSLLNGKISVGVFAAAFSSIYVMFDTMDTLICSHIANMTNDLGTIRNFISFLHLPERQGGKLKKTGEGNIVFKNVSFCYPNAKTNALHDISLEIKPGETLAIVGENGAGKSTFSRLLLGLYKPTDGTIYIDGLDSKTTDIETLSSMTSSVFQNFQKYKMTLVENVMVSDINKHKPDIVPGILKEVDMNIDSDVFPNGVETMLCRDFDGIDLSGGQWQRLSIVRGQYKDYTCIVLDEPTSAIDPIEEAELYKKFASMAFGKTAVIITHRLGSMQMADRIVVLDKGCIIEDGTHQQLMNKQGKYYKMYSEQAKWYIRE
jgi:ATP-binding cassette, subfamily B, bacterial